MGEFGAEPVSIDVGHLVRRSLASLYSSLVTRPTGQAVRMAIENILAEEAGPLTLSVVDFSQVTVIDFSCADEVVAKLLLRYLAPDRPRNALFILRGIRDLHRDPIEVVLERHELLAVALREGGGFELLGSFSPEEMAVWSSLEDERVVGPPQGCDPRLSDASSGVLNRLVERRVAFRHPGTGCVHALSTLLGDLA